MPDPGRVGEKECPDCEGVSIEGRGCRTCNSTGVVSGHSDLGEKEARIEAVAEAIFEADDNTPHHRTISCRRCYRLARAAIAAYEESGQPSGSVKDEGGEIYGPGGDLHQRMKDCGLNDRQIRYCLEAVEATASPSAVTTGPEPSPDRSTDENEDARFVPPAAPPPVDLDEFKAEVDLAVHTFESYLTLSPDQTAHLRDALAPIVHSAMCAGKRESGLPSVNQVAVDREDLMLVCRKAFYLGFHTDAEAAAYSRCRDALKGEAE